MRRLLAVTAAVLLLLGATAAAAPPVPVPPVVPAVPGAALTSPNVRHLGTIPLDGVGVSLRVVRVGGQARAFVSSAAGLTVYDATDPRAPLLLSHLPLYNWENEDIAVSKDGKTALLTEFLGAFYLHVVDVSDPSLPRLRGSLLLRGAHTVECADARCDYAFGSEGQTFDLRDKDHPAELPRDQSWGALTGAGGGHALHQDEAGYWISDTEPLVMFRLAPDPLHLKVLTRGTITKGTAYQHNNIRPRAKRYVPRPRTDRLRGPLRDGELLLGEGETSFTPECGSGSGAFSTWSLVGWDRGRPMQQLDVLRPVSGTVLGRDPAVDAMACSGHWFSARDGRDGSILVAAAWYEHGTRFLRVDPRTGRIRQVGWFQPHRGGASASYWMDDRTVWTVDYHSGIDVLAFDENPALVPSTAALDRSWSRTTDRYAEALRELCRAGARATPTQRARVHQHATAPRPGTTRPR